MDYFDYFVESNCSLRQELAIRKAGIYSFGSIKTVSKKQLEAQNLTKKEVKEIVQLFEEHGYDLKAEAKK